MGDAHALHVREYLLSDLAYQRALMAESLICGPTKKPPFFTGRFSVFFPYSAFSMSLENA
ncbi:hypothetical protein [Dyella psychrodurans]|uniref:Uncharacterized protein n=1 Tax=Dyella psychrodurans TaxID=1927960 RepID=A0A370WY57_9GAMM|nr:hypothetical protein [Dyella psychrodurans]RDS80951.1 hypothetical protein DWU99_18015 [Dyella psychrodurans]